MTHDNQFQYRVIGVVEATKGEPLPMRLIHTATVFAGGGYTELAAMLRAAGDAIASAKRPVPHENDFIAGYMSAGGSADDARRKADRYRECVIDANVEQCLDATPPRCFRVVVDEQAHRSADALTAGEDAIFGIDFGEGVSIGNSDGNVTGAPTCTCPTGDGSLRWPCPAHPPGADPQPYDRGERAHVAQVASDAGIPLGGAA